MTITEAYKALLKAEHTTQILAAKLCGYKHTPSLAKVLRNGGSAQFDTWLKLVNAMGYEIVLRKKHGRSEFIVSDFDTENRKYESEIVKWK